MNLKHVIAVIVLGVSTVVSGKFLLSSNQVICSKLESKHANCYYLSQDTTCGKILKKQLRSNAWIQLHNWRKLNMAKTVV